MISVLEYTQYKRYFLVMGQRKHSVVRAALMSLLLNPLSSKLQMKKFYCTETTEQIDNDHFIKWNKGDGIALITPSYYSLVHMDSYLRKQGNERIWKLWSRHKVLTQGNEAWLDHTEITIHHVGQSHERRHTGYRLYIQSMVWIHIEETVLLTLWTANGWSKWLFPRTNHYHPQAHLARRKVSSEHFSTWELSVVHEPSDNRR